MKKTVTNKEYKARATIKRLFELYERERERSLLK